jgi:hypothetical protein
MRIEDHLYFAPGVRFTEVNFDDVHLPEHLRARIQGFYLQPASECAGAGHAFAAGVLVLVCIDALARFSTGDPAVGQRFKRFARAKLRSFAAGDLADRLYEDFRNGLIHEGRIKSGAQFSLEFAETITRIDGLMIINPARLADEVRAALDRFIEDLVRDAGARRRLSQALKRDHEGDF